MATLSDVLAKHRDISKEVSPALVVGMDSNNQLVTLQIDASGGLLIAPALVANKRLTGEEFLVDAGDSKGLINYTVPVGKAFHFLCGEATSNGDAEWLVELNSTRLLLARNSYMRRNVPILVPIRLDAGETLTVTGTNMSFQSSKNDLSVWIYGKEVDL